MSSVHLNAVKCGCGALLALSCFAGAVVPRLLRATSPQTIGDWLPLGNCLSAGLLLGAGLLHFFANAVRTATAAVLGGDGCAEAVEHALGKGVMALLMGFYASLFIDRVLLRRLAAATGTMHLVHGHSHGVHDESGHHRHGDDNGDETADAPARLLLGRRGSEELKPATATASGTMTATIIVGTLLGFHGALEGVSLAVEPTVAAIYGGFVPLLIHKFFDGLILGIQAAKTAQPPAVKVSPAATPADVDHSGSAQQPKGHPISAAVAANKTFMGFVALWSLVTPAVMLMMLMSGGAEAAIASGQVNGGGGSGAPPAPTPATAAAAPAPVGPLLQCFGAGTFLYVGTMEILATEFGDAAKGSKAAGFAALMAGSVLVLVLESFHHHH